MLEKVDLSLTTSKKDYQRQLPKLERQLHLLQRACAKAQLGSLIVLEGWDKSGKGDLIRKLTGRLEPRAFSLHAVREPRSHHLGLPWMWRFWRCLPKWGHMAIFDHSWYRRVLVERIEGITAPRQWRQAYQDINSFERTLTADRYVLVKLFLHISKKEQKRRLKKLEKDPEMSWKVEPSDWVRHEKYDDYLLATEQMLFETESEWAPWTIIEATDQRWCRMKAYTVLITALLRGLKQHITGFARLGYLAGDDSLDEKLQSLTDDLT